MPVGLTRHYGQGHLHFITFSCYARLPLLNSPHARNIFVQELARARDEMGFQLIEYVVMPEHVHLLISEPEHGTPSTGLQKLKLRVSREMRKQEDDGIGQSQEAEPSPQPFWQPRFYDFNVYTKARKPRS